MRKKIATLTNGKSEITHRRRGSRVRYVLKVRGGRWRGPFEMGELQNQVKKIGDAKFEIMEVKKVKVRTSMKITIL